MEHTLQTLYKQKRTELQTQLGLTNIHEVPKLEKIVVNCSVGSQGERKQAMEDAVNEVTLITGQTTPLPTATLVRLAGDVSGNFALTRLGGALNALALLAFILSTVTAVLMGTPALPKASKT